MNTSRIKVAISLVALFVFSSWLPAEADDGDMFDVPVLSGMYRASDFQPENRKNAEKWDWPNRGMFHDEWGWHQTHARPMRVVIGELSFEPSGGSSVRDCPEVAYEFDTALLGIESQRMVELIPILPPRPEDEARFHRAIRSIGPMEHVRGLDDASTGDEVVFRNTCGKVSVTTDHVGEAVGPRDRDLVDRVYAVTLLESGDDLYDMSSEASPPKKEQVRQKLQQGDEKQRREAVEDLLVSNLGAGNPFWGEVLEELSPKEDELARRIHRRYRPLGTKSRKVAERYADVCERLGDVRCFLKLRVRMMRSLEPCVADVSEDERNTCPCAHAFEPAPVNASRLFRGLALEYQLHGERSRLMEPKPLARALGAAREQLIDEFVEMAEDPGLDEMNRLNAARIVYMSAVVDEENNTARLERLRQADLSPTARYFLDWHERFSR